MFKVTLWEDMSEKDQLITMYSDSFKEYNNFRPNIDPDITIEELEEALNFLERMQGMDLAFERELEEARKKEIRDANQAYRAGDNRFAALKGFR